MVKITGYHERIFVKPASPLSPAAGCYPKEPLGMVELIATYLVFTGVLVVYGAQI